MSTARLGSFEDLCEMAAGRLTPIARHLRSIILDVDPTACEVVRLGDRAATYGVGPRKMIDGYAYVMPQRDWVNLGFYRGAGLPDPQGLLEGAGIKMRHVKIRSVEEASSPAVLALLRTAVAERLTALGISR